MILQISIDVVAENLLVGAALEHLGATRASQSQSQPCRRFARGDVRDVVFHVRVCMKLGRLAELARDL
jgi:hypothetical protein